MSIPTVIPWDLYPGSDGYDTNAPYKWPITIAGRGFLIDTESGDYRWGSLPLLRQQADSAERPSEASINPENLWGRTVESWHKGAGQKFYDRVDSDPDRYWQSKGMNPWAEGELGMLNTVDRFRSSDESNLYMAIAGDWLFLADGQFLAYATDTASATVVSGTPAADLVGLTSDGFTVYAFYPDGLYVTDTNAPETVDSYITADFEGGKWVQGRLFAWNDNLIYNITENVLPAALYDGAPTEFTWVDAAAASGHYYLAGFNGDKSLIYYTQVNEAGDGLDPLVEAAQLPDGEIVRAVYGYLGFLLVGTNKGVRFAQPQDGPLTLGSLIETPARVLCFEGQSRFVWFGWSNFDDDSTGLGRLDLSVFNGAQPAYASDLMADGQGGVQSIVTFNNKRVFSVNGLGFYTETDNFLSDGWVETGQIGFGLGDDKLAHSFTIRHEPITGDLTVEVSKDRGGYVTVYDDPVTGTSTSVLLGQQRAETFQVRVTASSGQPTFNRFRLRGYPIVERVDEVLIPLLLGKKQQANGVQTGRDTADDLAFLLALQESGEEFWVDDGLRSGHLVLEDNRWQPERVEDGSWAGTFLARCKRFPTE